MNEEILLILELAVQGEPGATTPEETEPLLSDDHLDFYPVEVA
ncbi:MAG: hypothetical protein EBS01_10280, partial [Verrucomicrobia bacterium]|nr:hypothetical protein [Verrucomicrobiota bacterium]